MNEQINFPDDWHFGFIVGAGVDFNPLDVSFYDEQRSGAVRVFNTEQIRALGGGWAFVENTGRWYEYSRQDAASCKRCFGRRGDRLYLFVNPAVDGAIFVSEGEDVEMTAPLLTL